MKIDLFLYALNESISDHFSGINSITILIFCGLTFLLFGNRIQKQKTENCKGLFKIFVYSVLLSISLTLIIDATLLGRTLHVRKISIQDLFRSYILVAEGKKYAIYDNFFNIFLFIPEGILLRTDKNASNSILIICLTTILIETLQLVTGIGQFEICDMINNIIGGCIGIIISDGLIFIIKKNKKSRKK